MQVYLSNFELSPTSHLPRGRGLGAGGWGLGAGGWGLGAGAGGREITGFQELFLKKHPCQDFSISQTSNKKLGHPPDLS